MAAPSVSVSINAVDNASAMLARINSRIEAINAPVRRMQAQLAKFANLTGFTAVSNGFQKIAASSLEAFRSLSRIVAPLGAITGAASVAGIYKLTAGWAEFAQRLGFTAQRIGIGTAQLQGLQGAARLAGASSADLSSGMQTLQDNMVAAVGGEAPEVVTMMQTLGVSFRDSTGHARRAASVMPELIDRIAAIKDPTLQARAATVLFGGSAEALLPLIRRGSIGLAEYVKMANEYGVTNQKGADAAAAFQLAQTKLSLAVEGLGNSVAEQLAPVIVPFLDVMSQWIAKNRAWIATDIGEKVKEFAGYLQGVNWKEVGTEIHNILTEINSVVNGFGGWKTAAEGLLVFMAGKWAVGMVGSILRVSKILRLAFNLPTAIGLGAYAGFKGAQASGEDIAAHAAAGQTPMMIDPFGNAIGYRDPKEDGAGGLGLFDRMRNWLMGPPASGPMARGRGPSSDTQSTDYNPNAAAYPLPPDGPHAPVPPALANIRAREAFAYFRSRGMSVAQSAAMTAQDKDESNFDETLHHDHNTGYGLIGWRGSRLAQLQGRYHTATPSREQQLEFQADEVLTGSEARNARRRFLGDADAYSAGADLSEDVVRPHDVEINRQVRGRDAEAYARMFGDLPVPPRMPGMLGFPNMQPPVVLPSMPAPMAPPVAMAPAMAPPVTLNQLTPPAGAPGPSGQASLKISLSGFPANAKTSSNVSGDIWAGAPRVERPFDGYGLA